jgi:CheY-like chemotaxis protein
MKKKEYILMLEGDLNDQEISNDYFREQNIRLEFLHTSREVLPFLLTRLQNNETLPRLILLSLHSVPDSGLEVLQQIKLHDAFRHIPVVVLGENTQPELIKSCYEHGANTFINKPFTNSQTEIKIKSFLHYWFDVAEPSTPQKIYYS